MQSGGYGHGRLIVLFATVPTWCHKLYLTINQSQMKKQVENKAPGELQSFRDQNYIQFFTLSSATTTRRSVILAGRAQISIYFFFTIIQSQVVVGRAWYEDVLGRAAWTTSKQLCRRQSCCERLRNLSASRSPRSLAPLWNCALAGSAEVHPPK